jgi:hypothetical protein
MTSMSSRCSSVSLPASVTWSPTLCLPGVANATLAVGPVASSYFPLESRSQSCEVMLPVEVLVSVIVSPT